MLNVTYRFSYLAFALVTICLARPAAAQTGDELVTVVKEGTVTAASPSEAAREIQAAAITETARSQALDIIGEKRYAKNKGTVEAKIIRQAAKFIPFVTPANPVQQPDGSWKATVELRLSQGSLRKMILEAGLLNDADGPASILPMIAFVDRKQAISLRWWMGEPKDEAHKFLSSLSRSFYDRLQIEFSKQGFHMIKPQGTQTSPLPVAFRQERPSAADLTSISDFFQAPMALTGDVRCKENKEGRDALNVGVCGLKLQVVQAASGRTIAEVTRQFETGSGTYEASLRTKLLAELPELGKDLAAQVLEAWQRGTLNTNLIRLTLRGRLSPKQLSDFKTVLQQNVREVKGLKERLFEGNQVQLEVDYTGESSLLADRLRALRLPTFETRLSEASDKQLALDIRPRGTAGAVN